MKTFPLLALLLPALLFAQTSVWNGTSIDSTWYTSNKNATTYTISTAAQLAGLAQLVSNGTTFENKTINLAVDIDLGRHSWTPIGNNSATTRRFQGTFDGQNNVISGLSVSGTSYYAGLFGYVTNGEIRNVGVSGNVSGRSSAGVLVGEASGITITNSYAIGDVSGSDLSWVGGLVGSAQGTTTISNSYSIGDVSGRSSVGGLVGYAFGTTTGTTTISNSYSIGDVFVSGSGSSAYSGGLVGDVGGTVTIASSYVIGDVFASTSASGSSAYSGGLVGGVRKTGTVTIASSYVIGDVFVSGSSGACSGSLLGYVEGTVTIASSYVIGDVFASASASGSYAYSGTRNGCQSSSTADITVIGSGTPYYNCEINGRTCGSLGKTTAEMKTQSTYVGWDFVNTWVIDPFINEGYPVLRTHLESMRKTISVPQVYIAGQRLINGIIPTTIQLYSGTEIKPIVDSVFSNGKKLNPATDYNVTYSNNTAVSTAGNPTKITIKGKGDYYGQKSFRFYIISSNINISTVTVDAIPEQLWNGTSNPITPKPVVKATIAGATITLREGVDYTLSYTNHTKEGTATITIAGTGIFTWQRTATFKIAGTLDKATISDIAAVTYNSTQHIPNVTVTHNSITLTKDIDYIVRYGANTNAGTGYVYIDGIGKHTGTISKTFTINKSNDGKCYVYMENFTSSQTVTQATSSTTTHNQAQVTYTYRGIDVSYAEQTSLPANVGEYEAKATFAATANYNQCVATKRFSIYVDGNYIPVPSATPGLVYTGSVITGVPAGAGYTLTGHQATDADSYIATATLEPNFSWLDDTKEPRQIAWSIEKAAGTWTSPASQNATYSATLTLGNITLPTGYNWAAPETPLHAGQNQQFPATYTQSANHHPANGQIIINVAQATRTFPAIETIQVPYTATLTLANAQLPDNYQWENNATKLTALGASSYPATYTDPSRNYLPVNGNVSINVVRGNGTGFVYIADWTYAPIPNPQSPEPSSSTNGTSGIAYNYTGTSYAGISYSSATPPFMAGEYTVTATFSANALYNSFSASHEFTINRAAGDGTLSMADWYFGENTSVPVVTSSTNGTTDIVYSYYSIDGYTYLPSPSIPSNPGSYIVEATFPVRPNYNGFKKYAMFEIMTPTDLTVVWSTDSVFTYNKMVQSPVPYAEYEGEEIELMLLNAQAAAGKYEGQQAAMAIIKDDAARRRYNLKNSTKNYEILRKDLKPYFSTTLPDFKYSKENQTLEVPSEVFTDKDALTRILESIIAYDGFATDSKGESDNESVLKGKNPAVDIYYAAPTLSKRVETTQKATATIVTDGIEPDNYALTRPVITIIEIADDEAELIFCRRGSYCTELSEEVCHFVGGTEIASCNIIRTGCQIDESRCVSNMLLASCNDIGGEPIESCSMMSSIMPHIPLSMSHAPSYYNLKGQPLGMQKPTTPGVYIEKAGKQTRKILVK